MADSFSDPLAFPDFDRERAGSNDRLQSEFAFNIFRYSAGIPAGSPSAILEVFFKNNISPGINKL